MYAANSFKNDLFETRMVVATTLRLVRRYERAMQTAGIARGGMSVRPSVCHTPVLHQNEKASVMISYHLRVQTF